jgi:hypothetical protein
LPDGLFSFQTPLFGYILKSLGMENVGIFYYRLEHFTVIWHILWQCGIVCGNLYLYFSRFGMFRPRKIWQPIYHSVCKPVSTKNAMSRNSN